MSWTGYVVTDDDKPDVGMATADARSALSAAPAHVADAVSHPRQWPPSGFNPAWATGSNHIIGAA